MVKVDAFRVLNYDTREVEVESFAFFGGDAEAFASVSITLDDELVGTIIDVD